MGVVLMENTRVEYRTSGSYPVPSGLPISGVMDALRDAGFVEFVCDEAPVGADYALVGDSPRAESRSSVTAAYFGSTSIP